MNSARYRGIAELFFLVVVEDVSCPVSRLHVLEIDQYQSLRCRLNNPKSRSGEARLQVVTRKQVRNLVGGPLQIFQSHQPELGRGGLITFGGQRRMQCSGFVIEV